MVKCNIDTRSTSSSIKESVFGGAIDGRIRILKGNNERSNIRMAKRMHTHIHFARVSFVSYLGPVGESGSCFR